MDINVKNQDFLSKQLFYTGFGEEHRFELGEAMASLDATKDSFSLTHKEKINDVDTFTRLNFVRTKGESGMVFFNSYDLTLNELGKEPLTQNFRIQKWQAMDLKIDGQNVIIDGKQEERKVNSTLTKKEAFNAMQGRYPLKEFIKEEEGKERPIIWHISKSILIKSWIREALKQSNCRSLVLRISLIQYQ